MILVHLDTIVHRNVIAISIIRFRVITLRVDAYVKRHGQVNFFMFQISENN